MRADHRSISDDFENNPFCVRISAQYIDAGWKRITVSESPVLFFSKHTPVFAFYSWRHRCQCHTRGCVSYPHVAPWGMFVEAIGETGSSAYRSCVHAHNEISVYPDVMSFHSAPVSMFLKSCFVIVLVSTTCVSALCLNSFKDQTLFN